MKTVSKKQKPAEKRAVKRVEKRAVSTIGRAATRTADVLLAAPWAAVAEEGEAAILELAGALPEVGVSAQIWRPFEDRLSDARCLHLFGASRRVPAAGRKCPSQRREGPAFARIVARSGDGQADTRRGRTAKGRGLDSQNGPRVFHADAGVAARAICRRSISSCPIRMSKPSALRGGRRCRWSGCGSCPTALTRGVAEADPQPFRQLVGKRDFVLYAGAIEPKNQQLGFLWAMKNTDVPLVLLGDAAADCQWYLEECRRVAGSKARFIARADVNEGLVASALTACSCLVVGRRRAGGRADRAEGRRVGHAAGPV